MSEFSLAKSEPDNAVSQDDIITLPRIAIQAFCLTTGLSETLEKAGADRRMGRVQLRIQMGGIAAAIEAFREAATPNLILVEFRADEVEEIPYALDELSNHCDAGTRVVLVGPINDVQLYREAIRRGVSDYLVTPLEPMQIIAGLSDLYRPKAGSRLGRCVAFMPAKGGCGSSTIAHNVSWIAGARLSIPVTLVDADLPFGTAALNVNQDPFNGLADILFAQEKPDENMIDRTLCKVSDTLSLLAASSSIEKTFDVSPNAFDDVMDGLRALAPLTVIDLPHQWSGWVQRVVAACDDVIVVAEPELASLKNTKQIIEHAARMRVHDRPVSLLLNKINCPKRPEIPVDEFLKPFSASPHYTLPFDAQLFGTAANNGQMLCEVGASAAIEKTLTEIARNLAGRQQSVQDKGRKPLADILNRLVAFRR